MSKKPDIPKRLASRIRRVTEKVRQKRISIIYSEQNYKQSSARVAEYEADPDAFAERHYGRHAPDSYPVQTNLATNRERNAYHERRRDERLQELAELETQLLRVEAEVLVEVAGMRPSPGRVPWPKKLPAMKAFRVEMDEHLRREDQMWKAQRSREDAEFQALLAKEEAEQKIESEREWAEWRSDIEAMPPEEYAKFRAWSDRLLSGLKSGEFTFADILATLQK